MLISRLFHRCTTLAPALLLVVGVLQASCATVATEAPHYEDLPQLRDASWEFQLRTGDVLEIGVARDREYKHTLPIGADGVIDLPIVGELVADGKTRSQLRDEIESRFRLEEYYIDPQVTINVLESREPPQVAVIGAVRRPIVIKYRRDLSIGMAIARAEGLLEDEAFARPVVIVRNALDVPQVFRFDIADALDRGKPWPRLLPGDIVVAQGSSYRDIERSVSLARDFAVTVSQPIIGAAEIDRLNNN